MINARVLRVIDGDTLEVTIPKLRVRMDFIDAPETKGQEREQGLKTKAWLTSRVEGKDIVIDPKKFDMYDRLLGVVYDGEENVNGTMVKQGLVEIYAPALHDDGKIDK